MNEFPITPIRAQYADRTPEGTEIEEAINDVITELDKKQDIIDGTTIPAGTIEDIMGIDSDGKMVKGKPIRVTDGVLKVNKIDNIVPVIIIDTVKYYHKREFDLTAIAQAHQTGINTYINIITGESLTQNEYPQLRCIDILGSSAAIMLHPNGAMGSSFTVKAGSGFSVNYTSRSFTLVDSAAAADNNTKMYLPGLTAYYGFLSQDGKTFISYYSLETDVEAREVTSVSDGTTTLPVRDSRVDSLTPGTSLYSHRTSVKVGNDTYYIDYVCNWKDKITSTFTLSQIINASQTNPSGFMYKISGPYGPNSKTYSQIPAISVNNGLITIETGSYYAPAPSVASISIVTVTQDADTKEFTRTSSSLTVSTSSSDISDTVNPL